MSTTGAVAGPLNHRTAIPYPWKANPVSNIRNIVGIIGAMALGAWVGSACLGAARLLSGTAL